MGSPNFSTSPYPTLGMTVEYPDDKQIQDYRNDCLDDDENDPNHPYYLCDETVKLRLLENESDYANDYAESAKTLAESVTSWIADSSFINAFNDFGGDNTPAYTLALEYGYHDGFRLFIKPEFFDNWNTPESCFDNCHKWGIIPKGMTLEQFTNVCNKPLHFCIYTLQELATQIPLYGIGGGWPGGGYQLDANTPADHAKFKAEFDSMMAYINSRNDFIWN